jgi:hypothetical protein
MNTWQTGYVVLLMAGLVAAGPPPETETFVPAPVPDSNTTVPSQPNAPTRSAPSLSPKLWAPIPTVGGAAANSGPPMPGLTNEGAKERYNLPAPGVTLTVPLK